MKKNVLINQQISNVIAGMGHLDMLVISDAGLPIPLTTERVDIALTKGMPGLLSVLEAVLTELEVEKIIVAQELKMTNPLFYDKIVLFFDEKVEIVEVPHKALKELSKNAKSIIRTGEFTPFANIVLVSGVVF